MRGKTQGGAVELREYLAIVRRRVWVIAVTLAATMFAVVLITVLTTPEYAASTMVRVMTPLSGGVGNVQYNLLYGDRFMNTYLTLATSRAMAADLAHRLGMSQLPQVAAQVVANTELMQLTVTA